MIKSNDSLVAEYLTRVSWATAGLPPERRDELIRDLTEHIAAGRAELLDENEAQVREILDRLGDPEVIARAAAEEAGPAAPAAARPQFVPPPPRQRRLWPILVVIVAIIGTLVLCAGAFLLARTSAPTPAPMASVRAAP
jgi:uncharacterized membrane protein